MPRLLFAALAFPCLLAAQAGHKLLVISIDGLDARLLNDPALKVKAPNIRKLMREGASATVLGVAPSETWPAHASMVTGVSPWQHGILSNGRPASALRTAALWDVATAKGLKCAAVFWPATQGAKIAFDLPQLQETHHGNAVQLDAIAREGHPPGLVALIEKAFPAFGKELWSDSSAGQAAAYLLAAEKPDALFVHLAELDAEEHETAALSIYAREILENSDDIVGQLLARLPPGAIVALVSDHGFENSNHAVRPRMLLRQAGIPGRVDVEDGLIGTSDKAVADAFRKFLADGRSGLSREVPMAEVRAKAPTRARWVAAFDTLPDYVANNDDHGPAVGRGTHLGEHLLWPNRPGFRSVFILSGAGVRTIRLGEIDMLQIAPTLADVLGVRLPAARATSLWRQISR